MGKPRTSKTREKRNEARKDVRQCNVVLVTLVTESQGAAATEKHRWSFTQSVHVIQDFSKKLIRKTFQSNSYQGVRRKQFICLLFSHLLLPTFVFHSPESTLPCACRVHPQPLTSPAQVWYFIQTWELRCGWNTHHKKKKEGRSQGVLKSTWSLCPTLC